MRRALLLLTCATVGIVGVACGSSGPPRQATSAPGAGPSASGAYDQKPTVAFPSGSPSGQLVKTVLHAGTGATVAKGDLLVANYLGQIWRGKVFDNSYDRRRPAAFPIGLGQVIPGWDETLVGATIGSRVLLSIPPAKGYGSTGNPQAGIKGTDTLVFVVDLLGTYGKSAAGDAHATAQPPSAGLATVTGALGAPATVTVPHGLKPPSKLTVTPLAKGTGAAVKAGLLVIQYSAVNWSGKLLQSTWQTGRPEGTPVGDTASPSALDSLVGLPIGSRVLVELPAKDAKKAATDSDAIVVDIVAEPT